MISVDLGSNTIRFIEYDGKQWGQSFEKIVRTAEGLTLYGKIGTLALERIVAAIIEAKNVLDFASHEVVAVTTAAMRMASNAEEILQKIFEKTGILFRIIDGEEEALLTLKAVRNRLNLLNIPSEDFVLLDIGGGSTEIIVVSDGDTKSKSFPLGIVTLSEKAQTTDILRDELDVFKDMITHYVDELVLKLPPKTLILTAGTPTTLVAYLMGMSYASYDPSRVNGSLLTRTDCLVVLDALMKMDEQTRAYYVGVGREGLIATGIRILEMIFEVLKQECAVVIDDGVREGVALDYFSEGYNRHLT
ncbi:MAG: Ppx/GppA phosphatase family protein [Sulfuricurvum sp.]